MTHLTFLSREGRREVEKKGPWEGERTCRIQGAFKAFWFLVLTNYTWGPERAERCAPGSRAKS